MAHVVIPGWRYEHTLVLGFLGCCALAGAILGTTLALLTNPRPEVSAAQ